MPKIVCKKESTKLKINADQNPDTSKPLTKLPASIIIKALTAIKNKPNVKKVIGSVNKINKGLKTKLITERTNATITDVKKESTYTPGIRYADTKTAEADNITLTNLFI